MKTSTQNTCQRPFDEAMFTGYLDHMLSQAESQKIRIHLEDCPECRCLHDELALLRQTALATRFEAPADEAWPELPKTTGSRFSLSLGWTLLCAWLIVTATWTAWRYFQQAENPLEVFLYFGLPGGLGLLFLSVLIDRLQDLKTDRYRGVHR